MHEATLQWGRTGKRAAPGFQREFEYRTKKTKKGGWDRERRVVAKAEHIDGKENPRFVVTSLSGYIMAGATVMRRTLLCARQHGKPHIKEQFSLFADRVSTRRRSEPIRCGFICSTMAYILMSGHKATVGIESDGTGTGARYRNDPHKAAQDRSARSASQCAKSGFPWLPDYPWQDLYQQVWTNLRC